MHRLKKDANPLTDLITRHLHVGNVWMTGLLVLATWQGSLFAQSSKKTDKEATDTSVSARHILGLEGIPKNAQGYLALTNNGLKFQKEGRPAVMLSTGSILSVSAGQQDKQLGGVPVALGRAATPYGGGRVIALFSHKKYDSLTLEYQDENGGVHGAIFQLAKGQGQTVQNELAAQGVHIIEPQKQTGNPKSEDARESK